MKKVVHIIVPDSFNAPLGGMGVGSLHFINGLSDEFEFYVIGFPEKNSIPNYTGVYNVLPHTSHGAVSILASQIAYYHASITLPKPDLIHVYDWSVYMAGVHASKFWKAPLIASMRLSVNLLSQIGIPYVHNIQTQDGFWINSAIREMEIMGLKSADIITQVSVAYQKSFEKILDLKQKTVVIPNGIDLGVWDNYSKVNLPGEGKIKLVYIGRMVAMKGLIPLLQTYIPRDIDLIFIGSDKGCDEGIYKEIIRKSSQEQNIHFIGAKYGQDKINYLSSADAIIIPSLHEPFGIVGLEALASKSILLASRASGLSDFLNDDNSIFCGTAVADIELSLQRLLVLTDIQKEKLIKNGLQTCKEYSWDAAISKMRETYHRALGDE